MTSADQERADRLNTYLDARVTGNGDEHRNLDSLVADAVDCFFAQDDAPAPPPELTKRIGDELMNQATYAGSLPLEPTTLIPPSLNGRELKRPWKPGNEAGTTAQRFQHSRFARYAIAALLLLTLGFGYIGYDQFHAGPDRPSSIPAVVAPAATPEATEIALEDHPIAGAWQLDYEPWNPGHNTSIGVFNIDGSYGNSSDFSTDVGTWRVTGERSVELAFIALFPPPLRSFEAGFDLPQNLIGMTLVTGLITIELSDDGNTLTWTGFYEPRDANGEVVAHLEYDTFDGKTLMGTRLVPVTLPSEATPTS